MSGTEMMLIGGVALVAIYMFTKKSTPPPMITIPAAGTPAGASAAVTTSEVNAAAGVANNIINSIWG